MSARTAFNKARTNVRQSADKTVKFVKSPSGKKTLGLSLAAVAVGGGVALAARNPKAGVKVGKVAFVAGRMYVLGVGIDAVGEALPDVLVAALRGELDKKVVGKALRSGVKYGVKNPFNVAYAAASAIGVFNPIVGVVVVSGVFAANFLYGSGALDERLVKLFGDQQHDEVFATFFDETDDPAAEVLPTLNIDLTQSDFAGLVLADILGVSDILTAYGNGVLEAEVKDHLTELQEGNTEDELKSIMNAIGNLADQYAEKGEGSQKVADVIVSAMESWESAEQSQKS